ncbi:thioredoxin family protein [Candidatus Accumulibacter sp. ACC003]|uniref:thioredoxin family protein n=1 Tax=Candidatus Accumulibacter sp. ACC003 TaxID=2823334 RepID=UPI0025C00AB5|nr:thioredoxin family protein [Candidatus Accumulibacter sp. ACC003]
MERIEQIEQQDSKASEPSRATIDALDEAAVIEFGASWCGYCIAARPLIAQALASHPQLRHIRVEDGPGRSLGRSFGVKLWPTLVFLRQGQGDKEVARLIRPADAGMIERAMAQIDVAG